MKKYKWLVPKSTQIKMLRAFGIRRFRGINEGRLEDLGSINLLVGKNNSGKSSILEALLLASTIAKRHDLLGRDVYRHILHRRVTRGADHTASLWYNYTTEEPIEFQITLDGGAQVVIDLKPDLRWIITYPPVKSTAFGNRYVVRHLDSANYEVEVPRYGVMTRNTFDEVLKVLKSIRDSYFIDVDVEALGPIKMLLDHLANVVLIDAGLVKEFTRIEQAIWPILIRSRLDKQVAKLISDAYEVDVEGFTYSQEGGEYSLMALFKDKSVRVDEMGDGFRYGVAIVALALLGKFSTIMLEEPENHQHPRALLRLAQLLTSLTKRNRTQLLITTHSAEVVKAFTSSVEGSSHILNVYHLNLSDGLLKARRLESLDISVLQDLGFDIRLLDLYR
jgi:energy-coupling factor transporter ATP-binding protein EcfA2